MILKHVQNVCFYRTYEGLKPLTAIRTCYSHNSFYRTYEGLKHLPQVEYEPHLYGFYRTYEGLKLRRA